MNELKNEPIALIATVGTGGEKNPVWEAIAFSVEQHKPEFVCWLCSEKTAQETLPKVCQAVNNTLGFRYLAENYTGEETEEIIDLPVMPEKVQETHISQNPDDVQKLFLEYLSVIDRIRSSRPGCRIVADFTSGTKAMSAALTMAATARKVEVLSYMTGPRDASGRATTTTHAIAFEPDQIYAQGMLDRAMDYLNQNEFQTAITLAEQARQGLRLENPELSRKAFLIKGLAMAYKKWDLFLYKDARDTLISTARQSEWIPEFRKKLEANLAFLEVCVNGDRDARGKAIDPEWTNERLLDLYLNAKRRFETGGYDDCVSRCYRLVEYIAQQRLYLHYGIETDNVPFWTLKKTEAREYFNNKSRMGLEDAYRLLEMEFDDELGRAFVREYVGNGSWKERKGPLSGALSSRNQSLLAHGFSPISERNARTILKIIADWLSRWIPQMETQMTKGTFNRVDYTMFKNH
jgi:CRISPR-associated protein (TIGR02710 family)